jgi:general secretion pathway protein C
MNARPIAFVVWAAVAASAVFWLLRLVSGSPTAPPHTVAVSTAQTPRGDLSRVLGQPPAPSTPVAMEPALAARFKLLGVAAPRDGGDRSGLALIAVDGKPARGFKVGATVDGEIVLQSVHPRGAALGSRDAPPQLRLELPPLPPAATSNRPPGAAAAPVLPGVPLPGFGAPLPGNVVAPPIVTLPAQSPGVPPASDTQEATPVPPPPGVNVTR